jgi:hypothetical protein
MKINVLRLTFQFVSLVLLQVLVLNKILLFGYATPMIYPLFILSLPVNMPRWLELLLAFSMGLLIDLFSNTGGMHAFSLVLLAFARPVVLIFMAPKEGYDPGEIPSLYRQGLAWFAVYATLALFIHHLSFYVLEVFSLSYSSYILGRTLASVLFSFLLMLLIEVIFFINPKQARR